MGRVCHALISVARLRCLLRVVVSEWNEVAEKGGERVGGGGNAVICGLMVCSYISTHRSNSKRAEILATSTVVGE